MPRLVYTESYEEKETFCEREIKRTFIFSGSNAHPCLSAHLWVCSTEPVSASLAFEEGETCCWNMGMIYSDCTHHANLLFRGGEKTCLLPQTFHCSQCLPPLCVCKGFCFYGYHHRFESF